MENYNDVCVGIIIFYNENNTDTVLCFDSLKRKLSNVETM